ncbi:MAG TPA: site-specific integrase [Candidatus Binataceae bacterium]|jgi:integrase|nr:site-specific integrase [Candidatus Binataceae bacterium]
MKNRNRGMGAVYQQPNSALWWIRYHHRGRKYRESSHSVNHADAVRLLKRRLGEISQGRLVGPDVEKTTFEVLASMIRADYSVNQRRSCARLENSLGHLSAFFANALARDITTDRITQYIADRLDVGAAPASINRELACLKHALALAVDAEKVAHRVKIKLLQENNVRKGFFEPEQLEAIIQALPTTRQHPRDLTRSELEPVLRTAYLSGWRLRSEVLTRRRDHVDLQAGWLRLDPGETKNGEGRNFPLIPELRAILEAQLEKTRDFERTAGVIVPWLFHHDGKAIGSFRKTWIAACRAVGLPGKLLHDMRRSAVRAMERAGVSRSAAMAMVGHRTQSIYSRYAIADSTMLQEAGEKLAVAQTEQKRHRSGILSELSAQRRM